jgi:hypothetical protein
MDNQTASNKPVSEVSQTTTQPRPTVPSSSLSAQLSRFKSPFRSPMINILVFAGVVLLGGFMTYNFVVHQLTRLAGDSTHRASSAHHIQHSGSKNIMATVTPTPVKKTY